MRPGPGAPSRWALVWASMLAVHGCARAPDAPSTDPGRHHEGASTAPRWHVQGDAARGREVFESFECGRCHTRADTTAIEASQDCAGCHRAIRGGSYTREGVTPELAARFQTNVRHLVEVPSLDHLDGWLSRDWLAAYLREPHDVRPGLEESMPRLSIDASDAADLATYLVPSEPASAGAPRETASATHGAEFAARAGCAGCHAFGDRWPPPESGPASAPDLLEARARLSRAAVERYLLDPRSVRPASTMPALVRDPREAADIVVFLFEAPVSARAPAAPPPRLPLLDRPVSFDEVAERVLRRSCWHCHADESLAYGDGGPGNTGGFGFAPREVDVSSYEHVMAGGIDATGQRVSLFREIGGEPLFLRVLLARRDEERGIVDPEMRGMPLGLPALSPEQIQLVESWIAQGRPR